ncbi:MAG: hydrogenase maturation protease [Cytophagaceae bacterium]|nr:hydrogenase maturation protease [Gemmatimonadaceae bacterium]
MTRTLIAGFGNVLRGDDGFGVEVIRQLAARGIASASVELLDVGTGGIRLAHAVRPPDRGRCRGAGRNSGHGLHADDRRGRTDA